MITPVMLECCWIVTRGSPGLMHVQTAGEEAAQLVNQVSIHCVMDDGVRQGSSTRGPRSPLPWPAGRFEKITTNPSPASFLDII
jgi:hypothetical protein